MSLDEVDQRRCIETDRGAALGVDPSHEERSRRKTPDAIQLATAKMAGAKWFLTNDANLPLLPECRSLLSIVHKSGLTRR